MVNHHLLLADLALKEDGFGDLLPSVDAVILDEAHQLPDLVSEFFGVALSSRQLEAARSPICARSCAPWAANTTVAGAGGAGGTRYGCGCVAALGRRSGTSPGASCRRSLGTALEELADALAAMRESLRALMRIAGLDQCAARVAAVAAA